MAKKNSNNVKAKVTLDVSPYDLVHPKVPAPQRLRHDPRIPAQHLTAFWVNVGGVRVGRIFMVEYKDRSGWWYQAQVLVEGKRRPVNVGPAHPRRKLALEQVLESHAGTQQHSTAA